MVAKKKNTLDVIPFEMPDKINLFFKTKEVQEKQLWILYGSRFSAKTQSIARYLLKKSMAKEYFRCIIVRNSKAMLRDSLFKTLCDVIKYHNLSEYFHIDNHLTVITCKITGYYFAPGSFDEAEKIKGLESPTHCWIDEPISRKDKSSLKREDFYDIWGSLRNQFGIVPKMILSFNPIWQGTWIYKDFFETPSQDIAYLKVDWWDNPFCPQSAIEMLERMKRSNPKRYRVDGLGEWGVPSVDNPFFANFDEDYAICNIQFNPKRPFALSFDFNTGIMACIVVQWDRNKQDAAIVYEFPKCKTVKDRIRSIKEDFINKFFLPIYSKTNSITIAKKLANDHFRRNCYITGDNTSPKDIYYTNMRFYDTLMQQLNLHPSRLKVTLKNPPHALSYDNISEFLLEWRLFINKKCENTIADFILTETAQDENGLRINKKHHDPHYGDCFRYWHWVFIQNTKL